MQPFEIGRLTRLGLGYVGETGSREIQIDMSEWLERWPDGKIAVDVLKPGRKEYYLADTTVEDGILTWTVTYTDVAKAGRGMAQISIYEFGSGKVYKSRCVETIIRESADMAEDLEAPHPMDTWVARAVEAKEGALGAALSAAQSASVAKAAETVIVEARDRAEAAAEAAENSETIAANASANATEKAAEASASAAAAERYASDAETANDEVQGIASEVRDNADRAEAAAEGLETAVTEAEKAKNTATEQAQIAKTAAQNASVAVNNATTAAKAAADYAVAAQNASGAAENAAGAALNAMGAAGNAMTQAQESAEAAAESERNAKAAAGAAEKEREAAENAAEAAETARDEAIKEISNKIVTVQSENLFDRSSVSPGYYQPTSGVVSTMSGTTHCLIPVTAGTYTFAGAHTIFGGNVSRVPLFDVAGQYIKSVVGTVGEAITNAKVVTITISEADVASGVRYAGYSQHSNMIGAAMFVSGDTYPTEYIPYFDSYVRIPGLQIDPDDSPTIQSNILYGKSVVFDGDSICYAGNTATDTVGAGWAGRIGDPNGMDWHNVGVSGGTITSGLYASNGAARHWLSTYIDTIYSKYPSLDYLIFEGGTNDADLLTTDQIGALDPDDFSGEYDATTFYGALDTLLYKAVNYYPQAKIGFIVAQRMGTNAGVLARRRGYFERVIEACKKWSIPYIDLWEAGQLDPRLTVYYDPSISGSAAATAAGKAYYDGQHMTTVGYDILSPKIEAWMRTL